MATKLVSGLNGVTGCHFSADKNQLLFVERGKGTISLLDFVHPDNPIIFSGSTTLAGNGYLNLDPGKLDPDKSSADLHWVLIDNVKRQMEPVFGANIVNLGKVPFSSITLDNLQNLVYGSIPIPGNNDSTNQLVNDDVFAVRTKSGNVAKIRVVSYDKDIRIEWITYEPSARYRILKSWGWAANLGLIDFAISSDGKIAYVTTYYSRPIEPGSSLIKINLEDPNSEPTVIYSNKTENPLNRLAEIYLDEPHQQVYVTEASRLLRIDLNSGNVSIVLDSVGLAKGMLISEDLNYAYVSSIKGIRRHSLNRGEVIDIATGLNEPGYLTWADKTQSAIFVTEAGSNCVTIVETTPGTGSVRKVIQNVGKSPRSVALIDATHLLVCCEKEIYMYDLLENIQPPKPPEGLGLFKGIGRVLSGCINIDGKADTSKYPNYPFRFDNVPFGGKLSININHSLARLNNFATYRIKVDKEIRYDVWTDLKLNPKTHKYDIPVAFTPNENGFYPVHVTDDYGNSDLGMVLDSSSLPNKLQTITIEFADSNGNPTIPKGSGKVYYSESMNILVDNNSCFAKIEMPIVNAARAPLECGMIKYAIGDKITITYYASHPNLFANYSWRLGRAGQGTVPAIDCPLCSIDKDVSLQTPLFENDVSKLLGNCTAAAFYASVYVYAKATNGEYRQSQYDAYYTIAFALTPK